jgi:hypothetical protein
MLAAVETVGSGGKVTKYQGTTTSTCRYLGRVMLSPEPCGRNKRLPTRGCSRKVLAILQRSGVGKWRSLKRFSFSPSPSLLHNEHPSYDLLDSRLRETLWNRRFSITCLATWSEIPSAHSELFLWRERIALWSGFEMPVLVGNDQCDRTSGGPSYHSGLAEFSVNGS